MEIIQDKKDVDGVGKRNELDDIFDLNVPDEEPSSEEDSSDLDSDGEPKEKRKKAKFDEAYIEERFE